MSTPVKDEKSRIVVAMSGGVDSSVAAALLVEQGYDVIGMMLRLWNEPGNESMNRCCTPDAMALARRVCAKLGIPFYAVDVQEEFYKTVIKYFIEGYINSITPNPCLVCNKHIRWGFLYKRALAFGADFLATGHYAHLRQGGNGKIQLLRAADHTKDQSYVLHTLTQEHLAHTKFPLGGYTKAEVRELAGKFGLPVADRKDSQDLCFLGDSDYRAFLLRHAPETSKPGAILNLRGEEIGAHQGLAFYTIGQRKGLRISASQPLYVVEKDHVRNVLIVANRGELGHSALTAVGTNWIAGSHPETAIRAKIKIRYTAADVWGTVLPISNDQISIKFDSQLFDITPGQAAVIYDNDICLGGGIISNEKSNYKEGV